MPTVAERAPNITIHVFGQLREYCAGASELSVSATTTGQLWVGKDGGEKRECPFEGLPPIHCVKVAVV